MEQAERGGGGQLIDAESPPTGCAGNPDTPACQEVMRDLRNPLSLATNLGRRKAPAGSTPGMSAPSAYAVAAESAADVVAAVNFARERNLQLVIKGGGHSFQGPPARRIPC
jgi:FAD/FMN-containing dehydrogenase